MYDATLCFPPAVDETGRVHVPLLKPSAAFEPGAERNGEGWVILSNVNYNHIPQVRVRQPTYGTSSIHP